jgi:outer membrane protein TolC
VPWLLVILLTAAGCTRAFFRERADRDVEALLTEKSIDPRWDVRTRNWFAYPDPRARFADFDKPDHPKKPPDDPAAAALSPDSQPIRSHFHSGPDQEGTGYLEFLQHCDQHNRNCRSRPASEDNKPAASLGAPTQEGAYVPGAGATQASVDAVLKTNESAFLITLDQAVELAQFNGRELQDFRENLYLAALPVTFERFQFMPQVFAGAEAIRTWRASGVPGGPGSSWNVNTTGSVSQLFPTGAAFVTRLANQLVIDLGTGTPHVGVSNLALSLTQPLLRGGGWAVTLEPLTQAERTLVYAVRGYARYRTNNYVFLAGGTDPGNVPFSYPGLNAGVGLSIQAPSAGYLPTLLSLHLMRNEEENLAAYNRYLLLYREYQKRGDYSELQVGQVEQQIIGSQTRLLQRRQDVQNSLDQFKLQLGLPTRLPLELDDGPTRPMSDMLAAGVRNREDFNAVHDDAENFFDRHQLLTGAFPSVLPIQLPVREKFESLAYKSALAEGTKEFRTTLPQRWANWQAKTTAELMAIIKKPTPLPVDWQQPVDADLIGFELALRAYESLWKQKQVNVTDADARYEDVVSSFMRVMTEARNERRSLLRAKWPAAPPVVVEDTNLLTADLDRAQTVAAQVALTNRMEIMNARGQMVDAWRRIGVRANSLLGLLNVGYNLQTPSTPNANEPFALGGTRSTHQLVLSGELPLVRRVERNDYRTALIAYQRARRNLQVTEDSVLAEVRNDLRNLRVTAESYRIQQRAMEVAFDQVENSLDVLQSPPIPEGVARPGQSAQSAANAASLTQQLLSAQNSLVAAQNSLYSAWVNYLIARMTFYRDIERLPLDARGVWIDEPGISPPIGTEILPPPGPVGVAEPERFGDLRPAGLR